MDNNCHIPYLEQAFSKKKKRKWRIKPGFIALNLSILQQSHQIPLYLQRCVNKTDIIYKIVKIWVQQSSLLQS